MMEYTVQNLEYAVSVFYNGEQNERAKAHEWLTAAQRVPEAWNFVWELLQPTKGTEIQFYAATTLHTKILRCWYEVPSESHDELKNKILQAVLTYSKGPKIVTNRLCISLAAFILQQGTLDLAEILRPLTNIENSKLLLEVLTVIPEEYSSMTMGTVLRLKNKAALQQACPAVLDDMLRNLQSVYNDYSKEPPAEETVVLWTSLASCVCSWLTLGGDDAVDYGASLPDRMPICRALLTAVHVIYTWNEAVSDSALDACEACLGAIRAAGGAAGAGGGDPSRYPTAALQLLAHLATLGVPIMAKDDVPTSINEELLSALITCCVALAETHIRTLVRAVESNETTDEVTGAKQLLDLLLRAQAAPGFYMLHETRSNLVFGFWYSLQDEILNTPDPHPVWREVFSQLLLILVTKAESPAESALSKDDMECLRCYRQDIADIVMYCFAVLGDWCWTTVESAFNSAASESRREAALHIFLALSDVAPQHRMPQPLVNMLQHAVDIANVSNDKRMLNTALDCLGGYASWLSSEGGGPGEGAGATASALGGACVRAAGGALARCPAAAALALRRLCADCAKSAADLAPDIVRAAQSSEGRSDAWVRRQLVAAAGAALAAAKPRAATPLLASLAETLYDDLRLQASSPLSPSSGAECCAALLNALASRPKLAALLFAAVLPTLPPLAQHQALVEPLFGILKETISTLMDDMVYATEISQLAVAGFNTHPCTIGFDVVKMMVLVLGSNWVGARDVLHSAVACSARVLATDPSAKSDLTEGLFRLLQNITKKNPLYLDWIEDLLNELVELACGCVRLWEAVAARAACAWLAALALKRPAALHRQAPALTAIALRCIGGATPRNQIEPLAELLLSLNRAAWPPAEGGLPAPELGAWLRQALANQGFPTHHATDQHKQKFIAAIVKEKSSKRRILETIQEFSLVCRGLVGTEYARQTLSSKQLVA